MPDDVSARIRELIERGEAILSTKEKSEYSTTVDADAAYQWSLNLIHLAESAFGKGSNHYAMLSPALGANIVSYDVAARTLAYLKAAQRDWDNGYMRKVRELVEAEMGSDLLDQASELLAKGYARPAVVLAGAVLEQHLREMCNNRSISVLKGDGKKKTIDPLATDLAKATPPAFDAYYAKRIRAWADLRNSAAHGEPFDEAETGKLIADVTEFCAKHK